MMLTQRLFKNSLVGWVRQTCDIAVPGGDACSLTLSVSITSVVEVKRNQRKFIAVCRINLIFPFNPLRDHLF